MVNRARAVQLGERVVDAQVAQLAVEQRKADWRARQHDVEKRERVLPFSRGRLDLGRHDVEGCGEAAELIVG